MKEKDKKRQQVVMCKGTLMRLADVLSEMMEKEAGWRIQHTESEKTMAIKINPGNQEPYIQQNSISNEGEVKTFPDKEKQR